MTERNIISIIVVIAIIICVALLVRNPPSFWAYNPAAAGSFSTYSSNAYNPNYQGASVYNAYGSYYPTTYPTTTYPASFQTSYQGYPTYYQYQNQYQTVTTYDQCVRAGYTVTGSQCRTPSGQVFGQSTTTTTTTYTQPADNTTTYTFPSNNYNYNTGACYVGGCSQELCTDQPNAVSACTYSPQASCFKQNSMCTRQSNGQCGWTQTSGLLQCLGANNNS